MKKKTPELSKEQPATYNKTPDTIQKVEEEQSPTPTPPKPKSNAKFVQASKVFSPKISSIKNIREEVDAEVEEVLGTAPPTIEQITEAWNQFIGKVVSPSAKMALKNAALTLKDANTLLISVGTGIAENNIRQESDLPTHIRSHCKYPQLLIEYEVNPELAPKIEKPEVHKPVTKKEIWQKMVKQNPLVDTLRETLDLKPDV